MSELSEPKSKKSSTTEPQLNDKLTEKENVAKIASMAAGPEAALAAEVAPQIKNVGLGRTIWSEKARTNIRAAKSNMVSEKGIKVIGDPKFWILQFSSITLSYPYPLIISALVFSIVCMAWLFGLASAFHALYFLKCLPAVIANVFISIINATWFGLNGIFELLQNALVTIINQVAYFFVGPLYEIPLISNLLVGEYTGLPDTIQIWPTTAMSYYAPEPLQLTDPATGEFSAIAAMGSLLWYSPVIPGEEMYALDADGNLEYDEYVVQMATLRFPKLNEDARADGWWTTLLDRPPDIEDDFSEDGSLTMVSVVTIPGTVFHGFQIFLDAFSEKEGWDAVWVGQTENIDENFADLYLWRGTEKFGWWNFFSFGLGKLGYYGPNQDSDYVKYENACKGYIIKKAESINIGPEELTKEQMVRWIDEFMDAHMAGWWQ